MPEQSWGIQPQWRHDYDIVQSHVCMHLSLGLSILIRQRRVIVTIDGWVFQSHHYACWKTAAVTAAVAVNSKTARIALATPAAAAAVAVVVIVIVIALVIALVVAVDKQEMRLLVIGAVVLKPKWKFKTWTLCYRALFSVLQVNTSTLRWIKACCACQKNPFVVLVFKNTNKSHVPPATVPINVQCWIFHWCYQNELTVDPIRRVEAPSTAVALGLWPILFIKGISGKSGEMDNTMHLCIFRYLNEKCVIFVMPWWKTPRSTQAVSNLQYTEHSYCM